MTKHSPSAVTNTASKEAGSFGLSRKDRAALGPQLRAQVKCQGLVLASRMAAEAEKATGSQCPLGHKTGPGISTHLQEGDEVWLLKLLCTAVHPFAFSFLALKGQSLGPAMGVEAALPDSESTSSGFETPGWAEPLCQTGSR